MVRPKLTEHRRGLLIKLLSQEKEIIRQQAHLAGLTVSEYIRKCALNRPIRSRVSIHEGKRQEIIDRVAQLQQTAYLASAWC